MAFIKVVESRADADFIVHESKSRGEADLLVCKVVAKRDALNHDDVWCFVDSRSDATSIVNFIDTRANADLLICYVNNRGESGWRTDHPLQGKL